MRKAKGFTLIELMVVVAIIVVLAAALVPAIASANNKAKIGRASADLKVIASAIQLYKVDTGRWIGTNANLSTSHWVSITDINNLASTAPTAATCPMQLLNSSQAGTTVPWDGPYIAQLKIDPWGVPYRIGYQYLANNTVLNSPNSLAIWSDGPDVVNNNGRPPDPGVAGIPSGRDIQVVITGDTTR